MLWTSEAVYPVVVSTDTILPKLVSWDVRLCRTHSAGSISARDVMFIYHMRTSRTIPESEERKVHLPPNWTKSQCGQLMLFKTTDESFSGK